MASTNVILRLAAGVVLAAIVASSSAQTQPIAQRALKLGLSTDLLDNPTPQEQLVFDQVIDGHGAPWMRLHFGDAVLADGSYLLIASLADGAVQRLDARSIGEWANHTAYFNGGLVQVSLYAAPGSFGNHLDIAEVIVGEWMPGDVWPESQCGPTDDRVRSENAERCRILSIGCSGTIYTEQSCLITAGHCLQSGATVAEFNVPSSLSNGTLVHPPVEDQYSVNSASREFLNGGVGNDWGLFKVFNNSNTGLQPYEAQGALQALDTQLPAVGTQIDVVGYGTDTGVDNQTQQRSTGPVASISGGPNQPAVNHQADTTGGSSGSGVRSLVSGLIVAIHTHAGCNTDGSGANASTGITHPTLQAALVDYCTGGGGGVTCDDIAGLSARCVLGSRLLVVVRLNNSNHSGETLVLSIDGNAVEVTVVGRRAVFFEGGFGGTHVVSLTTPDGCVDPITVNCE